MKIRQTIFLLPLFLLAGCASAGGSQSRDLDLKELCTEEQVFQYADFEWGTDSEQLFKQSSLKFDEKEFVFVPHRMHFFDKVTEDAITL